MSKKKQTETPTTEAAPEAAATETAAAEAPAPEKTARRKREKAPAAPETAAAAPEAPKPDLVVFAFRLTQAERDAIHQTAGPRNATQFVRRVAVAFAREDKAAFETVLKEARQLRG